MNRGDLRNKARILGRIPEGVTDEVVDGFLDEACRQLQKDVMLLTKHVAFNVHEKFSLSTADAFNLTMATASGYLVNAKDVVLSTAQTDATGAEIASALQAIIQASGIGATATTVTYDEDTRIFTIEASAETGVTSIKVTDPAAHGTYYDSSYLLFNQNAGTTATGTTFAGDAAPFCTSEYLLPSDFLEVFELIYNGNYNTPCF